MDRIKFVLVAFALFMLGILFVAALGGCEVQHKHTHSHNYGTEPIIPRDKDGRIVIQIKPVRPQRSN